jgi:protein O-mannosyl-transferase
MRFLPFLLPAALALLAWAASFPAGGFSFDDAEAIVGNPVVEGSLPLTEAFERDFWHHLGDAGHYRPLAALSLRLDRALWGEWIPGYHATNILLHALVVLFATLFLASMGGGGRSALWGLAIFAAHPVLADSVAWISGRTSMLSALGGLGGLLAMQLALRRSTPLLRLGGITLAAALGLVVGLLAKEEAIVFAVAYLLLAATAGRRATLAALLGILAALGVVGGLRWMALGTPGFETIPSSLAASSFVERLPFAGRALLEALRLVFAPFAYPPSYRAAAGFCTEHPPSLFALLGWLPWCALPLLAYLGFLRARRGSGTGPSPRLFAASFLLIAVSFLPVLQIVPLVKVFAPRFLYLPLLLAAPVTGALLTRVGVRPRLALLLLLVLLAANRSGVYHDRESFERAVLAEVPLDVAAWNNLGLALEERGALEEAAAAWEDAIAIDPHYSRLWSNLGAHQLRSKDYETAARTLRRAVREGPRNPTARCNLANALLRLGEPAEAAVHWERATRLAPGMLAAWRGLARAHLRLSDAAAARVALDRALLLDPSNRDTLLLGEEIARLEQR